MNDNQAGSKKVTSAETPPRQEPLEVALDEAFTFNMPQVRARFITLVLELRSVGYSTKAAVSFLQDTIDLWEEDKAE